MRVDLAVYDRFHRLILTVETKKRFDVSVKWASQTRKNLVAQGFYPLDSYFLLATPAKFFLWNPESNNLEETSPDFTVESENLLKSYLKELGSKLSEIDEYIFEQVVANWLKYDVMYPIKNGSKLKWLIDSGLAEKIFQGQILFETSV